MKGIFYTLLVSFLSLAVFTGCNDEWEDEQFAHYVSFKAPINNNGVTRIYVPHTETGKTTYRLPVLVSGSTLNDRDFDVHIAVDPDTLKDLNIARFSSRTDLYYMPLEEKHYSFPETVHVNAGENIAYLDIEFDLNGLDLVEKWVLPLTITESPDGQYTPNYRKNYRKALLRVMPFNDYSGTYSGTNLIGQLMDAGSAENEPLVKSQITTYTVDENTIFFYAGTIDETRQDRENYKIYVRFDQESSGVEMWSDNPDPATGNGFISNSVPDYLVSNEMDATRPYLLHRTTMIRGIDYEFDDYTLAENARIRYHFTGTLTMQRDINTQIPDEDQAIEWD